MDLSLPPVAAVPAAHGGLVRHGVSYALHTGFRPLLLDLHVPAGPGPFPVVVWLHGGAFRAGDRRYLPDTLRPDSVFEALVAAGVAVATVDYRLSGEAVFPAQLDDVTAALRYLRAYAGELGLDADRLGVWGESAGATLGALAALTTDAVSAAVCWYPPTDLAALGHGGPDSPIHQLLGGAPAELPGPAALASPVRQVTPAAPPFLLVHGVQDEQVPFAQSEALHERLLAAGARSVLRPVEGARHCFAGYPDVPALVADAVAFLAAELAPRPAA
ncbi:alpha/beta hydrolase [Kitasatospora sp. NA04385]|uniref:alpha/beta hydrolase n=1 Tax=Kitasatospora sp. NA04385 TaxID=2742135 RepID=UPI001590D109|nr:alpha/beta hydrolase [Kitasatospora sp. NA04385]QKW18095.1 alpha/beta hydrolase [Kitasatospora sp. NA04385]